jgi:hypothetical protein
MITGVDPKAWGPGGWALIHLTARMADHESGSRGREIATRMYKSLRFILPCSKCRKNFTEHMVNIPIPEQDLTKWAYLIHKRISNDKITFAEAKQKWDGVALSWDKIWVFLESIAATHPSARAIDVNYRDHLYILVEALRYFFNTSDVPKISKDELSSRTMFKLWLKRIKKKFNVQIEDMNLGVCTYRYC